MLHSEIREGMMRLPWIPLRSIQATLAACLSGCRSLFPPGIYSGYKKRYIYRIAPNNESKIVLLAEIICAAA